GIDARGHAAIQPDGNHSPQSVPVVHEQLLARSPISLLGPPQQLFSIASLLRHQFTRYHQFRKAAEKVTGIPCWIRGLTYPICMMILANEGTCEGIMENEALNAILPGSKAGTWRVSRGPWCWARNPGPELHGDQH